MKSKLLLSAISKYIIGILLVGLLIFLPAGSLYFFNGWLMMGILFVPIFITGIVLLFKNQNLLKSRLNSKEEDQEQRAVVKLSGIMFLFGFMVAGLNYRFHWYMLPTVVSVIFSIIFLLSYVLYAEILRENTYLSRTIKVEENQKVIDTGLYGIVRHPMYSVTLLMFLSIPIVLGSMYAFFIFLLYPIIIAKRIKHEEALLERELEGYSDYKKKVKYRLIPFIW